MPWLNKKNSVSKEALFFLMVDVLIIWTHP